MGKIKFTYTPYPLLSLEKYFPLIKLDHIKLQFEGQPTITLRWTEKVKFK